MKNILGYTISATTIIFSTFLFIGCDKDYLDESHKMDYEDSLFFELEYNSLNLDTDTVDFDMDDTNGQT